MPILTPEQVVAAVLFDPYSAVLTPEQVVAGALPRYYLPTLSSVGLAGLALPGITGLGICLMGRGSGGSGDSARPPARPALRAGDLGVEGSGDTPRGLPDFEGGAIPAPACGHSVPQNP